MACSMTCIGRAVNVDATHDAKLHSKRWLVSFNVGEKHQTFRTMQKLHSKGESRRGVNQFENG